MTTNFINVKIPGINSVIPPTTGEKSIVVFQGIAHEVRSKISPICYIRGPEGHLIGLAQELK